ncbi:MAG: hypothetical protein HC771_12190 [Synechococcales cyanobacterium CRU_2_2]|nr:hypothetical protein [Synechococcales cyanobacterium CRU_2_2]
MAKALSEAALLGGQVILKSGSVSKAPKNGFGANALIVTQEVEPSPQPTTPASSASSASPPHSAVDVEAIVQAALGPLMEAIGRKDAELEAARQQNQAATEATAAAEQRLAEAVASGKEKDLELAQTQSALEKTQSDAKTLEDLGKLIGKTGMTATPVRVEVLGEGSAESRQYEQLLKHANSTMVEFGDRFHRQYDGRAAREYLHNNRQKVREGLEAVMKGAGFLQGAGGTVVTNAPTDITDVLSTSFKYLSEWVRIPSDGDLIYRDFARFHSVPGVAPRLQGAVPSYPFLPGPTTISDRVLTPVTPIDPNSNPVTELNVPVTILELGLGKNAANAAIALTRIVQAFSMTDLEKIVQQNLGRDYQRTVDLIIRSVWFGSNTTFYNNRNELASLPSALAAGAIGTASRGFLRSLFAQMRTSRIPTYSGGLFVLVLTPNQLKYLVADIERNQRWVEPTTDQLETVSRILRVDPGAEYGGPVSGFKGILDGFMLFEQNIHSVGAPGTEGVQNETLGVGARVTETCFAAGADTVCWATALPVEIIPDEVTDFRRRSRFVWYSHENAADLNVNAVLSTGQERRVIKINFTRTAV